VPEDNIEKRVKRDRVPYDLWVKQGAIEATPGNVVDYDIVRARILEDCERFLVREIAIDRWNSTQISTQLQEEGLTVALFGQGFASMSAPAKELERLVAGELFDHGANPVLRWMASNCAAAMDPAGNIKPDKAKSNEKIDGIVAVLMGLGRAIAMHEEDAEPFIAVIG
jgi:phage terminase large subunit-like protein